LIPLIYVKGLEIKETTETASSASFLDIYLQYINSILGIVGILPPRCGIWIKAKLKWSLLLLGLVKS
jgi:hypothetical protein